MKHLGPTTFAEHSFDIFFKFCYKNVHRFSIHQLRWGERNCSVPRDNAHNISIINESDDERQTQSNDIKINDSNDENATETETINSLDQN